MSRKFYLESGRDLIRCSDGPDITRETLESLIDTGQVVSRGFEETGHCYESRPASSLDVYDELVKTQRLLSLYQRVNDRKPENPPHVEEVQHLTRRVGLQMDTFRKLIRREHLPDQATPTQPSTDRSSLLREIQASESLMRMTKSTFIKSQLAALRNDLLGKLGLPVPNFTKTPLTSQSPTCHTRGTNGTCTRYQVGG